MVTTVAKKKVSNEPVTRRVRRYQPVPIAEIRHYASVLAMAAAQMEKCCDIAEKQLSWSEIQIDGGGQIEGIADDAKNAVTKLAEKVHGALVAKSIWS